LILDAILADKRIEVAAKKTHTPLDQIKAEALKSPAPRDFAAAVTVNASRRPSPLVKLIAEIKKASPSKGLIRENFDPIEIAQIYKKAGASAISVLTDEKYFQGKLSYLKDVHEAVNLPLLRKDFIVDPYQIYEARAYAADAILLIVAALTKAELSDFMALADDLGMAALVEVHTSEEFDVALEIGARIIGINNRNLYTFDTTLDTTFELASKAPEGRTLVSESGIFTRADVEMLAEKGIDAILVGESLMRQPDPGVKVKELLGIG